MNRQNSEVVQATVPARKNPETFTLGRMHREKHTIGLALEFTQEKMDFECMQALSELTWEVANVLRGKEVFAEIRESREQLTALQNENQFPVWKIGLAGIGAFVSILFGGGGVLSARRARNGISVLVDSIEQGGTVSEIKKRISKKHHPEIERVVPR